MKKMVKRVFGLLCAILILASSVDMNALALTIQDKPNTIPIIDVEWQSPIEIVNVEMQEKQFIVSTKTDKGKINNMYFSFPTDGGVRFHADKTGYFNPSDVSTINYTAEGAAIVMQANDTTVKFFKTANPWRFEVYNAENEMVIWYLADHMYFGYDEKGELQKVKIASAVDEYEKLFGLGERFNGLIQNNKTIEMWNFDSMAQLVISYGDHNVGYKNIPILHSNNGYTVFHNSTYYGVVDVAESKKDECSFEFYGPILDMYVWTGETVENIARYNELTGSTVTVPKYALSYWAGQSSSMWYSEGKDVDTIQNILKTNLDKYDGMNTPIKMLYLEGVGIKSEYSQLHNYLSNRGVKYLGWMKSTYETNDDNYTETMISEKLGYTASQIPLAKFNHAKRSNLWLEGKEYVMDYTNPEATVWLTEVLTKHMENGLNGMMVDYNDTIPMDAYYPYLDVEGDQMHNLSQYFYSKAVYDVLKNYYGEGNFVNIVRAGCAGSQSYGAVFGGDQPSSFLGLQESVYALLSSSSSGINVWGSDIGGLGHTTDNKKNDSELYARWLQFGTFSPLMRAHGQTSWRDPWAYSKGSTELFQKYYWTRENIVNLVNSGIVRASVENYPLTQSMIIAYPDETKLAENESQYLFCDSLLVVPVTESGVSAVKAQFPKGRWVNIWDGTVIEGDCEKVVDASLDTIPVYLEAGSAIPITFGEDLKIGTVNTVGKNAEALVVAPAIEKKVNTIYTDKETKKTYTCDALGENTYSVTSDKSENQKIVVVMGLAANSVKAGNSELKELQQRPTSTTTEVGYYRDLENNSTIIVTDGNWSTLEYSGTTERLANIALNANVTTAELKDEYAEEAQNITDGDYETSLSLPKGKNTTITIDLKDSYKLNKILVKWGSEYARGYKMEVSDSNDENAKWVSVYEKDKGEGGTDKILLEDENTYRYIRISDIDTLAKLGAKLVEVEVYGDEVVTEDEEAKAQTNIETTINLEKGDSIDWMFVGVSAGSIILICAVLSVLIAKKRKK